MLATLMLAVLAQSSPPRVVIWGGGTTREAAATSLEGFKKAQAGWPVTLVLKRDFPRILETATVPGLKPGFFVVALGVCASEADDGFRVPDFFEPAVYSREAPLELACPEVARPESEDDPRETVVAVRHVALKSKLELSALVQTSEQTEGDFVRRSWTAYVFLRDQKGVAGRLEVPSGGDVSNFKSLDVDGQTLVLTDENVDPSCFMSEGTYEVHRRRTVVRVVADKLDSSQTEKKVSSGKCPRSQ